MNTSDLTCRVIIVFIAILTIVLLVLLFSGGLLDSYSDMSLTTTAIANNISSASTGSQSQSAG